VIDKIAAKVTLFSTILWKNEKKLGKNLAE
jgi:hypothetical protein